MKLFSLRAIIDDILLIVRNNNISESEDLSRAQIAHWVLAYRDLLLKKKRDEEEDSDDESNFDESLTEVRGPLELEECVSQDNTLLFARQTKDDITDLLNNAASNIIAVFDQEGEVIQQMNELRRHYHYFRKYTWPELTWDYDNNKITIKGTADCGKLKYIWVKGIFQSNSDDADEEDINIPGWMIPDIKQLIFKNELAFMVRMVSDDDNNSTLDGIKPQTPTPYGAQNPEK